MMAMLAAFLFFFGYLFAQEDFQMACPSPPIYPRCTYDLNVMVQIEALGVVCIALIACGVFLNRRIRGAFHLLSFLALLVMVVYVSHWFI